MKKYTKEIWMARVIGAAAVLIGGIAGTMIAACIGDGRFFIVGALLGVLASSPIVSREENIEKHFMRLRKKEEEKARK